MSTLYTGLGIEELVDEVEILLRNKLNDGLIQQQERWNEADEERADRRGVDYVPIELEPVSNDAFHVGYIPSLVLGEADLGLDRFPYVAITPGDTSPDPEDASADHFSVHQNNMSIHAISKASWAEGAEIAWRRSARMAEAIYAVVFGDPKMRQLLGAISNPARVRGSEPFRFNPEGQGEDSFWVAAGTDYIIKNYSTTPEEV